MKKVHFALMLASAATAALQAQALVLEDFELGGPGIFLPLGDFGVVGPAGPPFPVPEAPFSGGFSGYLTTAGAPGTPPFTFPAPVFGPPAVPTPVLEGGAPVLPLLPGTIDGLSPGGPGTIEGTIIQSIPFAATAGDVLTFDFNFLTMEPGRTAPGAPVPSPTPLPDFAFFTIQDFAAGPALVGGGVIADSLSSPLVPSPSPLFAGGMETGVLTTTPGHTFASTGTYVLTIGVIDWGDPFVDSGLVVDNVVLTLIPEPATMSLLGMGLAAFALRARRIKF